MSKFRYPEIQPALEQVIGYLNFSSGSHDPAVFRSIDQIQQHVQPLGPESVTHPVEKLAEVFYAALEDLPQCNPAFADIQQAERVIRLTFEQLLPEYRRFHSDLLFHLPECWFAHPYFVARCFEVTLQRISQPDEITADDFQLLPQVLSSLNDYVGYRPTATLEKSRHQAYDHEKFRPVPVYIRGAGVSHGPHQEILEKALQILRETDPNILSQAYFDLNQLDEIAVDVRAYDFDHPVNRRPNYHFGLWDPDHIGNDGYYHRFVIHHITLDAMLKRLETNTDQPHDFRVFEVAAVLAGTMLMGAGVSGAAPDSHDSNETLSTLLPVIANYRDDFYETLFDQVDGAHRELLEQDMKERRQPFGGARQHLNAELGARRASQVQHVQLSKIYAKMGYAEASAQQAEIVPVASARLICQIDCLLSASADQIVQRKLSDCMNSLLAIEDLLHRGIQCGAILDPWNLLGFEGNFPLFPALENTIPDHRADDLIAIVEHTLDVYSHLLGEAAASGDLEFVEKVKTSFSRMAHWWRQYAAHEVSSLDAVDAEEVLRAAEHVAEALRLWKEGGASAGDLRFWSGHASIFQTAKAYQLVIDALLERQDLVASQALLIHWLSQADWIGLVRGETSYHELVFVWLNQQRQRHTEAGNFQEREDIWLQICKFYDFLEANAESYWQVPQFALADPGHSADKDSADLEFPEMEEDDNPYQSAYDEVTFNDSTDDGIESELHEGGGSDNSELEEEADRIVDRLSFLNTLAMLWFEASNMPLPVMSREELDEQHLKRLRQRAEVLEIWGRQAEKYQAELARLLDQLRSFKLPRSSGDYPSMVEYDRARLLKESVMDRVMTTSVEMRMAVRGLQAVNHSLAYLIGDREFGKADLQDADQSWVLTFAGVLLQDRQLVESQLDELLEAVKDKPLLYIPLSKGGDPHEMIETRVRQQCFQRILASLPLLGRFRATFDLLEAARAMERNNTVGFGAVTEFDEMFRNGFSSMVFGLIKVAEHQRSVWTARKKKNLKNESEELLIHLLEQLTESMLGVWLSHSRTLRLSVLEKTIDQTAWENLVQFIKRYGGQLFTQTFLGLGNIRAILHQGVEAWLNQLQETSNELDLELLNDLEHELQMSQAVKMLTLILEAVIENFSEYRDYNSTTTQSDRGDLLYTFLDFIRLRTKYDRVAWHLKPVVWAHAIMVRNQENGVAGRWRRQLAERVDPEAERYLSQLRELQRRYAMQMPTIADRLSERFIQPLHIDRICALVAPAMNQEEPNLAEGAFELLQKEAEVLTRQPMGVGLEVPTWLIQLEQEVDIQRVSKPNSQPAVPESLIEPIELTLEEIQEQLDALPHRSE